MQNSERKNNLISLTIFLLAASIEVLGLILLRLVVVDSRLSDSNRLLQIGFGLLVFSCGLSGIVTWLRYKYLSRNYSYFPVARFLGNTLLFAVIGLVSTQIIYVDTGKKYEFNLHNTSPINS